MTTKVDFDVERGHKYFAVQCFNDCWKILEKAERTEADNRDLIHTAHASLYHWEQVGKPINTQRGKWMLAKVYITVEDKEQALYYAQRCLALTLEHGFKDFDLGYAYEAMARGHALDKNKEEFERYYQLAEQAAEEIKGEEDKKYFVNDLKSEPWFGMK